MILVKRASKKSNRFNEFGDAFPDGRLVAKPEGKIKTYHLREAILMSKRLGRPLTDEEMAKFEIRD